ncbi:MAG: F0F1 ATP synthase subunit B [Bacillota bacterium]|nr:F0F1 ATP synthase subunit B [Bacillota bacterium]
MMGIVVANLRLGLVEPNATFFFTLGNAIGMFLIMKYFLFKPINAFMKSREREIQKQYDDAQKAEDEANSLKSEYELKVSEARQEGEKIIKEHVSKAEVKAAEIIRHADEEAKKYKEKAEREISDERMKATAELKSSFAELTILAASKVVGKELDAGRHKELISNVISEVGDVKWQN